MPHQRPIQFNDLSLKGLLRDTQKKMSNTPNHLELARKYSLITLFGSLLHIPNFTFSTASLLCMFFILPNILWGGGQNSYCSSNLHMSESPLPLQVHFFPSRNVYFSDTIFRNHKGIQCYIVLWMFPLLFKINFLSDIMLLV